MRKILSGTSGVTLVMVLLVLVVLSLLGVVIMRTVTTDARIAFFDRSSKQALFIAEAGLHRTMAELNNNTIDPPASVGGTAVNLNGGLITGTYAVSIERLTLATGTFPRISTIKITSTGTAGRGIRTVVATVRETGVYPEIYDFAFFARSDIILSGSCDTYDGDVYSGGNLTITKANAIHNGDALCWGNMRFSNNGSILDGSVLAHGNIDLDTNSSKTRVNGATKGGDAICLGTIAGTGIVTGTKRPGTDPGVHEPGYYTSQYKVEPSVMDGHYYNEALADGNADGTNHILAGGTTITGSGDTYNGVYYVGGDLTIHGSFSGNATFVIKGNLNISGDIANTGNNNYAFIVNGNVNLSGNTEIGNITVGAVIYANGNINATGSTEVHGSVISFGNLGITGGGNLTVHYTAPSSSDLYGPPRYFYNLTAWKG